MAHALEVGKAGARVTWVNPKTGATYVVIPESGQKVGGKPCRNFVLIATDGKKKAERRGKACQSALGRWEIS